VTEGGNGEKGTRKGIWLSLNSGEALGIIEKWKYKRGNVKGEAEKLRIGDGSWARVTEAGARPTKKDGWRALKKF